MLSNSAFVGLLRRLMQTHVFDMRLIVFITIAILTFPAYSQSRRVAPATTPAPAVGTELTVKQMFDEANTYNKIKFAEYEQKKIAYTERLRLDTERQQRQLAAKYATSAALRPNLTGEDIYYVGLLNWIAENYEATTESLTKYLASTDQKAERMQNARSILVYVFAKQKKFDDALKHLSDYESGPAPKMSDRWRMNSELAKSYVATKDFPKANTHAAKSYDAAKTLVQDPTS